MQNLTVKLQKQFNKMCETGKLFKSSITGREVWKMYLKSFTEENNPVFRDPESSIHNCNHCNNFIRRYGNIVAINNKGKIITLFDLKDINEYQQSADNINKLLKKAKILNVFKESYNELKSLSYESCNKTQTTYKLGIAKNVKRYTREEAEKFGVVKPNEIRTFHHFHMDIPKEFVDFSTRSIEAVQADYRSDKEVFQRAMVEIPLATLELVRDLINQGSLLNGETHLHKVLAIIELKKKYEEVPVSKRDNWCWINSYDLKFAKFKNELIGVLCTELAEGEELNKACTSWNKRVDPVNYKKAVAPVTKAQKEKAEKTVTELGYLDSFSRRLATLKDINISEIIHANAGDGKVKSVSIFDKIQTKTSQHKRNEFEDIEEVGIEKFMKDILPNVTSVEAYLENKHEGNFVTLTTAGIEDSKPMFPWSNLFSWTYKGNLAGKSMIKENVYKVGGNIDALVRVSLQWNDEDTKGLVDFDLHSRGTNHIYYSNRGKTHSCGGHLDTDMINPRGIGIENITWKKKIEDGTYDISVKNFNSRDNKGFKIEIEYGNENFNYFISKNVRGVVDIATIIVKDGVISIKHNQPVLNGSKDIYNLETQNFHKVNLVCLSPNHWGDNKFGNKHYFFMLEKAKIDTPIRGFHAENLNDELTPERKVLDYLADTIMIKPSDNQLTGLGFNATVKDEVILRLKGNFKRVIKVKF